MGQFMVLAYLDSHGQQKVYEHRPLLFRQQAAGEGVPGAIAQELHCIGLYRRHRVISQTCTGLYRRHRLASRRGIIRSGCVDMNRRKGGEMNLCLGDREHYVCGSDRRVRQYNLA
jgi:hypothetical protein